ncbi:MULTISPECIES: Bug family tripartite tricarboxylate transporter substrate binding protein [Achromobacter]|uniref:Tripartite tricarboxylate transporter substrate binding protein n=1 Tax=Achromobacter spanius TaxID=217203 RepID=A0ABY8GRP3_9BURK|nr:MULTISPECIES: tripartite tricarboxylate transporter substrate binding protein [Achromobacter]WAI83246.1 tripartite tricarboxylate transporter substrate binding protein [Achromobacter spanius]WEX93332.1 tripartite tricarboxylate transporter substrate binding protein [Achromobacter sp. SS2-2022]WFP07510.1 tripartite tricarboxylate transporter substrate binding protein [Achromobacter spanius]
MHKFVLLVAAALALPATPDAHAQAGSDWPTRPITLVVPFPPGGTTDLLARLIAREASAGLGQSIVVENRPGAGGGIGAAAVARAKPDGYTLLMGTVGTQASNQFLYAQLPYDAARDFAPVTLLANSPNVLLVNPKVGVNSVAQLLEQARRNPGSLNFASTSLGGSPHLSGELFNSMAHVDIRHVPYKGSAPAMTDLIGGQVQLMYDNLPSAMGQIKSGAVKALAVTTAARVPMLPDVPTVAESGLPGYEVNAWFGLLAPAGTPAPIIKRLQTVVADAMQDKSLRGQVEALGAIPVANTPQDYAAIIRADTDKWRTVIRQAGIHAQ